MRFSIFDISYRSKCKIFIKDTLNNLVAFAKSDMHLNASLTMSYVVDLLVSHIVNISEKGREVVVSHMLEGEFPKLFVFVRIKSCMITRVLIASTVSCPDIISFVCQHKAWRLSLVIDEPCIRTIKETVLQNNRLQTLLNDSIFFLKTEDRQDVPILGNDLMLFTGVVVKLTVVSEVKLRLRMLF
jgi:hypothetical protein